GGVGRRGERGDRQGLGIAASCGGGPLQALRGGLGFEVAPRPREPAVAKLHHALERMVALAAKEQRRVRLLLWLGIEPGLVEVDELPMEFRFLLGPQFLHGEYPLAQQFEACLVPGAVVFHLIDVPTPAHGKDKATTRELVEARRRLRRDDRGTVGDEAEARAEPQVLGCRRSERERYEGIVRVFVALRQLPAAGKRGASAHRNVRVLAHEERFKAALLECTRELGDVNAVIGWEVVRANLHAQISAGFNHAAWRRRYHVRLGADQARGRRASAHLDAEELGFQSMAQNLLFSGLVRGFRARPAMSAFWPCARFRRGDVTGGAQLHAFLMGMRPSP